MQTALQMEPLCWCFEKRMRARQSLSMVIRSFQRKGVLFMFYIMAIVLRASNDTELAKVNLRRDQGSARFASDSSSFSSASSSDLSNFPYFKSISTWRGWGWPCLGSPGQGPQSPRRGWRGPESPVCGPHWAQSAWRQSRPCKIETKMAQVQEEIVGLFDGKPDQGNKNCNIAETEYDGIQKLAVW